MARLSWLGRLLPVFIAERLNKTFIAEHCTIKFYKDEHKARYYEIGEGLFLVYSQEIYDKIQENVLKHQEWEKEQEAIKKQKQYEKLKKEFEK